MAGFHAGGDAPNIPLNTDCTGALMIDVNSETIALRATVIGGKHHDDDHRVHLSGRISVSDLQQLFCSSSGTGVLISRSSTTPTTL